MKPQVVAAQLGKRLALDAIVSSDSGTITTWWARHIHARKGQMFSCSGNLASMACGLPCTIAAQVAYPDRQCVAFVGDGQEQHARTDQMVFLGNPEYACDLQPMDFAGFARLWSQCLHD